MIHINQLDHLNMKVRNLEETVSFYQNLFGFEEKERGEAMGGPFRIIGISNKIYLCLYEVGETERVETGIRLNHFGFNIENFEAVYDFLVQKGYKLNYGGIVKYENSRSLYVEDPNGFEIELSEVIGGGLD